MPGPYYYQWKEGYVNAKWYLDQLISDKENSYKNKIIIFYRDWIKELKDTINIHEWDERQNKLPYLHGGFAAIKKFLKKNKYKNLDNEEYL